MRTFRPEGEANQYLVYDRICQVWAYPGRNVSLGFLDKCDILRRIQGVDRHMSPAAQAGFFRHIVRYREPDAKERGSLAERVEGKIWTC